MLISCTMPTRGRPAMAAKAVECWLSQTYQPTELVIIDDMDAPSFPGGLSLAGVQYHMMRRRMTIGEKRNLACSRSAGEIIAHFDDDDYSAPGRLADQLGRLVDSGKQITGYCPVKFTDGKSWWEFSASPGYAPGSTLMFRRDWWEQHGFATVQQGEDNEFIWPARSLDQIVTVPAGDLMYATIHPGNTCPREISKSPAQWRLIA